MDFVEVFNSVEGGSERAYNILMTRMPVFAFGTDDYHYNSEWADPDRYFNKSFIIVNTNARNKDALWNSILKGNFYASTGARMSIKLLNRTIVVNSDCVSKIEFRGPNLDRHGNSILLEKIENNSEAKYEIKGEEAAIWIRVSNSFGSAISQPFYIRKILK